MMKEQVLISEDTVEINAKLREIERCSSVGDCKKGF